MNEHREQLERIYKTWGKDYEQVAPWYRHTPIGDEAGQSEYAGRRGDSLRGFSPGYSEYLDEWSCRWKTTDADELGASCIEHPYPSVGEALKARIPDPAANGRLDPVRKARDQHPDSFLWVQNWLGPWEMARAMLGTEEVLVALYTERAELMRFIGRVFEHYGALIANICTQDVDMVGIGDDWGAERSLLIDPEVWVRVFKPLYRQIFAEIHRADKISLFHCCGCAEALYPHMIDIGVDVLHPLQPGPVDIERVGKEYRGRVSFWGGLDTRQLLEKGSPEEVKREVRRLIATLGNPDGGLVVGACTSVHTGTPVHNIEAIFSAARSYSWL
jgi:uroporphyrinogen decarboxylase